MDWEEPLDIAIALFNDEQYDLCIRHLRRLLADTTLPRYPRISGSALLASALDDWYEAQVSIAQDPLIGISVITGCLGDALPCRMALASMALFLACG